MYRQYLFSEQNELEATVKVKETDPTCSQILFFPVALLNLTLLSISQASHVPSVTKLTDPHGKWEFCLSSKMLALCQEPAHEIPPMTRSWGENLTSKADQDPRDFEKLPPALTLKMISVFLMLALIDYPLISVAQAEGLPRSLSK